MYGSPGLAASREAKKLCSKVKGLSSSFDKLITSWKHNCSEVSTLLHKLRDNCEKMNSVIQASKNRDMSSVKELFPDLFEKLIGNLIVDIEDICLQIKLFMRILRDVNTAMQLQAYESAGIISSLTTSDTVFGGEKFSSINATEDILQLQKSYYQYNQELVHKEIIIKKMLSPSSRSTDVDDYWLKKSSVTDVINCW